MPPVLLQSYDDRLEEAKEIAGHFVKPPVKGLEEIALMNEGEQTAYHQGHDDYTRKVDSFMVTAMSGVAKPEMKGQAEGVKVYSRETEPDDHDLRGIQVRGDPTIRCRLFPIAEHDEGRDDDKQFNAKGCNARKFGCELADRVLFRQLAGELRRASG